MKMMNAGKIYPNQQQGEKMLFPNAFTNLKEKLIFYFHKKGMISRKEVVIAGYVPGTVNQQISRLITAELVGVTKNKKLYLTNKGLDFYITIKKVEIRETIITREDVMKLVTPDSSPVCIKDVTDVYYYGPPTRGITHTVMSLFRDLEREGIVVKSISKNRCKYYLHKKSPLITNEIKENMYTSKKLFEKAKLRSEQHQLFFSITEPRIAPYV